MKVTSATFVGASSEPGRFPAPSFPEVAFAGRSNVGKSSAINRIVGRRGLARTSSTPGRTQQLNFFAIDAKLVFVDLPGYGYAKVSKAARDAWRPLVESYLGTRGTLAGVILIVDVRRGLEEEEHQLLEFLGALETPVLLIATKVDKLNRSGQAKALQALAGERGPDRAVLGGHGGGRVGGLEDDRRVDARAAGQTAARGALSAPVPAVAVVVPVRDRAGMVVEAVTSVLAQTYRDFALVVVDDGSTDGSADAALAAMAAAPAGSAVLRQEPRGVAAARNAGAAAVDSAWVAFLDSDDLWHADKLAAQMAWLAARPSYRIAQTGERWLDGGRHRNPRTWHRKEEWLFPRCLERCLVSPSAVVLRHDLYEELGGFDETFPVCEDYELWLRVALREPVGLVDEELVVKRGGHADQLSRSTWGLDRWRVAALAKLLAAGGLRADERAAVVRVLRTKCEVLAGGAARRGRSDEAARYRSLADAGASLANEGETT